MYKPVVTFVCPECGTESTDPKAVRRHWCPKCRTVTARGTTAPGRTALTIALALGAALGGVALWGLAALVGWVSGWKQDMDPQHPITGGTEYGPALWHPAFLPWAGAGAAIVLVVALAVGIRRRFH